MLFEKQVDDFPSSSDARNHPVPCFKMSRCFWSERTPVFMPFFRRDLYGIINKLFPPHVLSLLRMANWFIFDAITRHCSINVSPYPIIYRCPKYVTRDSVFLFLSIPISLSRLAINRYSLDSIPWKMRSLPNEE